jgi:ribosomal protein L11 methyltransferase
MSWLALTVELEARASELLSDALLEQGAQSVCIEALGEDAQMQRICAIIGADAHPESVLRGAAAVCGLATPRFSVAQIEDDDWVRKSQSQFQALALRRLWIGPTWREPPEGCAACVRLDPGLAFGTGSHPSTRLMLRFLDEHVRGGESVLDYGCGSGILGIAAAKLGAARIDAVDIDPQALHTARANAALNGVALHADMPEALGRERYDVVMANILSQPLIVLAPALAARVAERGLLLLSGILDAQSGEVVEGYAGLIDLKVLARDDGWALVGGRR